MYSEKTITWLAALVQFVCIVDFMIVMPLGPDMAESLPITNADIGLICGSYTLAIFFSGIAFGRYLDRFDRRLVAVISIAGLSIATLSTVFAWDLYALCITRGLAGIFAGPASAISMSMVADAVPPQRRGKAMATVMGSFSLSAIVAIPLGLELARIGSWKTPFYAISFLGIVIILLILKLTSPMIEHLIEEKKMRVSVSALMKNNKYIMSFLMMGTAMCSSFLIIPNISAYFQHNLDLPRESLGGLYMIGGVFSLLAMQLGGRWSDKIGPILINIAGTTLLIIFIIDGFICKPITPLFLIFSIFMSSVVIRNVTAMSEATKLPLPHERAGYMALLTSFQHLGNGIGAILSTVFLTSLDNGFLINMNKVALLAIFLALFQPFFLVKIRTRQG